MIGLKDSFFSTYSLAKLLLDSLLFEILLSHSSINQSHLKLQFKSSNRIQSCSYERGALAFVFLAPDCR